MSLERSISPTGNKSLCALIESFYLNKNSPQQHVGVGAGDTIKVKRIRVFRAKTPQITRNLLKCLSYFHYQQALSFWTNAI